MYTNLKTSLWQQFGALIDYLEHIIETCPDSLWRNGLWNTGNKAPELSQAWYVAYHTLFWLDLYLTGTEDGFLPPAPFSLIEQDEDGPIPKRVYTRDELLMYLQGCRQRCYDTIRSLNDEIAGRQCAFGWGELTFLELMIYNLRHAQEHSAQLNMMLGQNGVVTQDYPTRVIRHGLIDS